MIDRSALPPATPEPPALLGAHAVRAWFRLYPELRRRGHLTMLDQTAFMLLCASIGRAQAADEALARESHTLRDDNGAEYRNPWLAIRQDALRLARDFAREFLLDPSNPNDAALLGLPDTKAR